MIRKKLLSVLIVAALSGCNEDINFVIPETDTETPVPEIPDNGNGGDLPDTGAPESKVQGALSLDGTHIFGSSIACNDQPANNFEVLPSDAISCYYENTLIASFESILGDTNLLETKQPDKHTLTLAEAIEFRDNQDKLRNATALLKAVSPAHGTQIDIQLSRTQDKLAFSTMYENDLDLPPEEFDKLLEGKPAEENLTDKLPSTHVPDIEPEVTPGTSTDLNAGFVAANAEEAYQYKPTETILSKAVITDSAGIPVAGLSYFSRSSRGKTNENGEFEFVWGDTISFGIDTFELGNFRGNKTVFTLTDLGAEQRGRNAEALVKRYAENKTSHLIITDKVESVFAQYPNVINEAISLSLNDKDTELSLGNGETEIVPAEFENQFKSGVAAQIDQAICNGACGSEQSRWYSEPVVHTASADTSNIQADINKLWGINEAVNEGWKPVKKFHVFSDATNFYGSVGDARGQAAVNISNRAFPVMMARNDQNYWISFGQPKAYDEQGLAYITETPSNVKPELAGANTATFGLPFVSIGEIGKGKIMVMGNARYNSILVCPRNYSWNSGSNVCATEKDSQDMENFFHNVIRYLTGRNTNQAIAEQKINIGTNIPHVYFARHGQVLGNQMPYQIHDTFNVETHQIDRFDGVSPDEFPLLILNGFEYNGWTHDPYLPPHTANTSRPKLTQKDVNALIDYVNKGGSILVMETVRNTNNTGELGRLLDAAGIAFGMGESVVKNGNGSGNANPENPRANREYGYYVIERYPAVEGGEGKDPKPPYNIDNEGNVTWDHILDGKPDKKPKLEVASYAEKNDKGESVVRKAYIREEDYFVRDKHGKVDYSNGYPVVDTKGLHKAINDLLSKFEVEGKRTYELCKLPEYHYEINCLEYRPGNGISHPGTLYRPIYTKLDLGSAEAKAMIKAADLGTNIERLYQHERYFRTKGREGERLNSVDLNRIYSNMSVWLWNDLNYRYESDKADELGFKRFTEFMNCYTNNQGAEGTTCSDELRQQLASLNMVYGPEAGLYAGQMNPSYPLNYMEKPLTRLMLGRSYWDYDVKVDVRQFPGEPMGSRKGGASLTFDMTNNTVAYFAGNRQATGQWAEAHRPFTVSVSGNESPVTVTVGLHDDLTGREKHELALKRPPRMQKSFTVGVNTSETFTVPYGGLIYVQGGNSKNVNVTITGTVDAPLYDSAKGVWVNDASSSAPIGDVVSNAFIYTAPKANLMASNIDGGIQTFAEDLDTFASDLNEFYARDEGKSGTNNKSFTHKDSPNNRHAFVNDVAISIGAAHSGYPVMNGSFDPNSENMPTVPLNDWLIWHEVGHNAAEAPFTVEGATEVANNLVGLYMQQKHLGYMARVENDIRIAPAFVKAENGHAWGAGGAAERLVMFAQLKEWADKEFDLSTWYANDKIPAFYSTPDRPDMNGFNLFKLMHRLTRNESDPAISLVGENKCYRQGLGKSDALMLCASYAAQTDLTEFFKAWNPGVVANILPGVDAPHYDGGITDAGVQAVKALRLPQPKYDPLSIDSVTYNTSMY